MAQGKCGDSVDGVLVCVPVPGTWFGDHFFSGSGTHAGTGAFVSALPRWGGIGLVKEMIQKLRERLQNLQPRAFLRADFLVLELPRLGVRDVDRSQSDV